MSRWLAEKRVVLEAARKMLGKGLVVGTAGNVSLRLPTEGERDLLAITPSALPYDLLHTDDIQIIDFQAEPVEGDLPPSVETALHIGIYQARKNINAVIHTHSVFASAVSVAGMEIPAILDDQVVFLGGEIRLAQHAPAGSREQAYKIITALENRNAVLIANHGGVGIGRTMPDALIAGELLEKTAKVYYLALSIEKVNLLPADAQEEGKALYNRLQNE